MTENLTRKNFKMLQLLETGHVQTQNPIITFLLSSSQDSSDESPKCIMRFFFKPRNKY